MFEMYSFWLGLDLVVIGGPPKFITLRSQIVSHESTPALWMSCYVDGMPNFLTDSLRRVRLTCGSSHPCRREQPFLMTRDVSTYQRGRDEQLP